MITVILMLFGGFYVNTQTIPPVLSWSEWGAVHAGPAWRHIPWPALVPLHPPEPGFPFPPRCAPPAVRYISHLYWAFMGFAINDFAGRTGWETNGIPITGDQILTQLDFDGNHLWQAFMGLLLLVVGPCLLLLLVLLVVVVVSLSLSLQCCCLRGLHPPARSRPVRPAVRLQRAGLPAAALHQAPLPAPGQLARQEGGLRPAPPLLCRMSSARLLTTLHHCMT